MTATPLHPDRHRHTRLRPLPDMTHAARQSHAILGFDEIATAATDYPVVLLKHAQTGRFNVVALYGHTADRNAYIVNGHWHATYVPLATLRYPFFASATGAAGLALDETSHHVSTSSGERLFDDAGAQTPYLTSVAGMLQQMQREFEAMQAFVQALATAQLIRPLSLLLRFDDRSEVQVDGLYSIARRALAALPDDQVVSLHRQGYLSAAHVMGASLRQLERLRQLHDAQSPRRIASMTTRIDE